MICLPRRTFLLWFLSLRFCYCFPYNRIKDPFISESPTFSYLRSLSRERLGSEFWDLRTLFTCFPWPYTYLSFSAFLFFLRPTFNLDLARSPLLYVLRSSPTGAQIVFALLFDLFLLGNGWTFSINLSSGLVPKSIEHHSRANKCFHFTDSTVLL